MGKADESARGPYRADQIAPGEPCELSHGHLVECLPTGARGSQSNLLGASVVGWDPDVESAGVDTGFAPGPDMMRAPDVAVGNIPDEPGWAPGVPQLAIEYADTGQDEASLADKIHDLLGAGVQYIWVVRLVGPRRVEVHQPGQPVRTMHPGEQLRAPGVLANPVPVEALYDRDAARRAVLANLLQAEGYKDLDAVRAEGTKQGTKQGHRDAVRDMCELLGIELSIERLATLDAMGERQLQQLRQAIKRERRWPE